MNEEQKRDSVLPPRDTRNGDPEHFVPGNFHRGTAARPKRAFESQEAAEAFARERTAHLGEMHAYRCSTCGAWHLASSYKRGERRGDAA